MVLDNQCYLHIKMRLSRIDFVSITTRFVYTYPENTELIGILTFPDLILNYVNGPRGNMVIMYWVSVTYVLY